jgi:hypothetical protein
MGTIVERLLPGHYSRPWSESAEAGERLAGPVHLLELGEAAAHGDVKPVDHVFAVGYEESSLLIAQQFFVDASVREVGVDGGCGKNEAPRVMLG